MTAKDLRDDCRALDIEWPVSSGQLRGARNLQVQVWHPDRFQHDRRLLALAEEKLKRVNVAFERLTRLLTEGKTAVCEKCHLPVTNVHNGICSECGGESERPRSKSSSPQHSERREKRRPTYADISGRWQSESGWVEFMGDGPIYRYTEWGFIGQVGDGRAIVSGNVVTLQGRNVLLGNYSLSLVVQGSLLVGVSSILGFSIPYQLRRV